jgi:hypothetical protein
MLGVDWQDLRAGRFRKCHDELTADDQRFLVGEREVDAFTQRRDGRPEASGANDRIENYVGVRFQHQLHETLGSRQNLSVPGCCGGLSGIVIAQGDPVDLVLASKPDEVPPRALCAQTGERQVIAARNYIERLQADGARGA